MNKRTVIFAALLGALAAPAYADGFRFVGGEAGWLYVGTQTETREMTARAGTARSSAIR